MLKEINFCGIYFSPVVPCLLITGLLYIPLRWLWNRISVDRHVWNRPLFEFAVFCILFRVVAFVLW